MTSTRHNYYEINTIIIIMQGQKKTLYEAVGKVIRTRRKELGQKLTIFCYENDIPTTTLTSLEKAKTEACFYNIYKIAKALNLSFEEFAKLLEKELPDDFMKNE